MSDSLQTPLDELTARLKLARRLTIQVNPEPYVSHTMTVLKYLRLEDATPPDEFADKPQEWAALLDHWDADNSHALQRHVFYMVGDKITVSRYEAGELLQFFPDYFNPQDVLTARLAEVIKRGEL